MFRKEQEMVLKVDIVLKVKGTINSDFFFYAGAFVISLQSNSLSLRVTVWDNEINYYFYYKTAKQFYGIIRQENGERSKECDGF